MGIPKLRGQFEPERTLHSNPREAPPKCRQVSLCLGSCFETRDPDREPIASARKAVGKASPRHFRRFIQVLEIPTRGQAEWRSQDEPLRLLVSSPALTLANGSPPLDSLPCSEQSTDGGQHRYDADGPGWPVHEQ